MKQLNNVFIRVPKTGSEALAKFFIDNVLESGDKSTILLEREIIKPKHKWQEYSIQFKIEGNNYHKSHMTAQYAIDNNLVPMDAKFIATIRDPIEKQLSLYLSNSRLKSVKNTNKKVRLKPSLFNGSIETFREEIEKGFIEIEIRPHQNQFQYEFLKYKDAYIGTWWCYDYISSHIEEFIKTYDIQVKVPLQKINQSIRTRKSKEFIDVYYTPELKKIVSEYHKKDLELYNTVRDHWQTKGYSII